MIGAPTSVRLLSMCLLLGSLVLGCSTRRQASEGQGQRDSRKNEEMMISSERALLVAHDSIQGYDYMDRACSAIVEPEGDRYNVTFFQGTLSELRRDRSSTHPLTVSVEAATGRVLAIGDAKSTRPAINGSFIPLTSAQRIASGALAGFEEYDKFGVFVIELNGNTYHVSYPLKNAAALGSRRSDYAIQVQLDASSGKVLKILAAS
ncbi:hypothetical protein WMF30_15245 [Sorangium sp. So ce134]